MPSVRPLRRILAWGAITGQVLFTAAWLTSQAIQAGGYSVARHDISDLGALTANRPWVILIGQGLSGVLTMAFALLALGPALAVPGRRAAVSAWLVALSAVGLDDLSDAFFRLDCRAADLGCTEAAATSSGPGAIHAIVGTVTFAILVIAPFALARRMRLVPAWRSLAGATLGYGVLLLVAVVAFGALSISVGGGYAQRAVVLLGSLGVVGLALRVLAMESRSAEAPGKGSVRRSGVALPGSGRAGSPTAAEPDRSRRSSRRPSSGGNSPGSAETLPGPAESGRYR